MVRIFGFILLENGYCWNNTHLHVVDYKYVHSRWLKLYYCFPVHICMVFLSANLISTKSGVERLMRIETED